MSTGKREETKSFEEFVSERLDLNKKFWSAIFCNLPLSMMVMNSKYGIELCNEKALQLFGCVDQDEFMEYYVRLYPALQPDGSRSAEKWKSLVGECRLNKESTFEWVCCDMKGILIPMEVTLMELSAQDEFGEKLVLCIHKERTDIDEVQVLTERFNKRFKAILDATPLCLNLWNEELDNLMCNRKAVELFGLKDEQQYLDDFEKLSPKYQPNGELSSKESAKYIKKAFEKGYVQFKWLHCDLDGEEIPAEITLCRIDEKNDEDQVMVAGFTRDLRPQLAGGETEEDVFDAYFLNHISDKALFNIVARLSDEWFFVLDVRTSLMQFYGKGGELFGVNEGKMRFPEGLIEAGIVYEEDEDELIQFAENMKKGIYQSFDIRFMPVNEQAKYYRLVYQAVVNRKKEVTIIVGKAVDINEQKILEIKSKTDLLTNCYNKITAETMISNIIHDGSDKNHALFIIDIDNFKAINDNLGHHFGDLVLSDVATKLKECFRNADIVGRIGGDEFIVLLKNVSSMEIIKGKAERIANAFKHTYSGENKEYKISGSIGIARFPEDGTKYDELYKAADKALYQAKLRGKDCYTFYDKSLLDGTMKNRTILENANRIANSYMDTELITMIFHLLYETKDIQSSINASLQYIGKQYNADRAYIFESFDNGKTYSNTYEWCKEGIRPEIQNLQGIEKETLIDFFDDANSDGIMYSNDLTVLKAEGAYELMAQQDIKSFLHAQIREKDKDVVKLFLGMDDCTNVRVWSEKEINSLQFIVKFMSTFLYFKEQNDHKE